MSIQIITLPIVVALCAIGFLQHRRAINRLKSGQRKWRKVAFHHSAQTVSARNEVMFLERLIDQCRSALQLRENEFRIIVKHLWGADLNRTLQDVLDRYDQVVRMLGKKEEACNGFSQIITAQDAQIKDLKKALEIVRNQRDAMLAETPKVA